MGDNPEPEATGRESFLKRLWHNRKAILLWGIPLLACDLIWRTAWFYIADTEPKPDWAPLILLAGFLPLVAWFYFYMVADREDYRALILAGKVNSPEEVAAIEAVKLSSRRKYKGHEESWKALKPRTFGQPQQGYSRAVRWAPGWMGRPLRYLLLLPLLVLIIVGQGFLERIPNSVLGELPVHFAGLLFASFFWGVGGCSSDRSPA